MIAFVVKGGREEGLGHIFRATYLAKSLGEDAIFFLTSWDDVAIEVIEENGFEAVRGFEPRGKYDLIAFDVFNVDQGYARIARKFGKVVMFDSATSLELADAAINAIVKCSGPNCYNGLKYLVLRKEFFEFWKRRKVIRDDVKRVLVMFGGSDPSNYTIRVMKMLNNYDLTVVLGPGYRWTDYALNLADEIGAKAIVSPKRVAGLMFRSDIVITSLGLTLFESMCVGTPAIAICQNDLQRWLYSNVPLKFVLTEFDDAGFLSAFRTMLSRDVRARVSREGKEMCDGLGVYRVIEVLEVVLNAGSCTRRR